MNLLYYILCALFGAIGFVILIFLSILCFLMVNDLFYEQYGRYLIDFRKRDKNNGKHL